MAESLRLCSQHEHSGIGCGSCFLEQWFEKCPADYQQYLYKHFRSGVDSRFQGAFFELLIYGLLSQLDYSVRPDPDTSFGTPDFLATTPFGESFYCEATVVEPEDVKYSPRDKTVMNALYGLKSPKYWLQASDYGELRSNPPLAKIVRQFQQWIDRISQEDIEGVMELSDDDPSCSFSHDGWTIELTAIPRSLDSRGQSGTPLAIGMARSFGDAVPKLIDAARKKAATYRRIDKPLVVAVNDLGHNDPKLDVSRALFGYERETNDPDRVQVVPRHGRKAGNWLWDDWKNKSISAILLFNGLQPHTIASASVCLYENPWARYPSAPSLLRLPYATLEGDHLRWYPGKALHSILGLPQESAGHYLL